MPERATKLDAGITIEETLLHITEICRHGARAPISVPTHVDWMDSLEAEELTPVGFRQHYIAGKDLLLTYPTIFDKRLNSKQIYIRSTGYNRTIQSAMGHLYGIFEDFPATTLPFATGDPRLLPATHNRVFDDRSIKFDSPLPVAYSPYPIHTPSDVAHDEFLKAENPFCNRTWPDHTVQYKRIIALVNDSSLMQDSLHEVYKRFNMKIPKVEKNGIDLDNGFLIADFINSDQANAPVPLLDAKIPEDAKLIKTMQSVYAMALQTYYASEPFLKVAVTGFMSKIRDDFIKIKDSFEMGDFKVEETLRYQLFSAHDSTITAVLMANKYFDPECLQKDFIANKLSGECFTYPDLASQLVFELVAKTRSDGWRRVDVRCNLNGTYLDFCKIGKKGKGEGKGEGEGEGKFDCEWKKFVDVVNGMVVEDFKKSCYLPPKEEGFMKRMLGWAGY
jgi:hypothetical protein